MLYRHEPESPLFRIDVVRTKSQGVMAGTMPAHGGMVRAHNVGTVEWRETGAVSVTHEEARKHGYPQRVPSAK